MQDAFFHFFSMLLNGAYASNLKLGGNLEFSWHSCNILRYCSNRCIVWFFIPANCPAQANRKFPVQLYVKIQILFEPPFWICKWANHLSFLAMVSIDPCSYPIQLSVPIDSCSYPIQLSVITFVRDLLKLLPFITYLVQIKAFLVWPEVNCPYFHTPGK